jgi:hypothetical protein
MTCRVRAREAQELRVRAEVAEQRASELETELLGMTARMMGGTSSREEGTEGHRQEATAHLPAAMQQQLSGASQAGSTTTPTVNTDNGSGDGDDGGDDDGGDGGQVAARTREPASEQQQQQLDSTAAAASTAQAAQMAVELDELRLRLQAMEAATAIAATTAATAAAATPTATAAMQTEHEPTENRGRSPAADIEAAALLRRRRTEAAAVDPRASPLGCDGAWIRSLCLRHCVHGASIGGDDGPLSEPAAAAAAAAAVDVRSDGSGRGSWWLYGRQQLLCQGLCFIVYALVCWVANIVATR